VSGRRDVRRVWPAIVAGAVVVGLAAMVPLVWSNGYAIGLLTTMFITIVLAASWNFLLGMAGVWNFGQLALYAAGGYAAGALMLHTSLPPALALIGGGLASMLLAVVVAVPTLRLFGIYTALVTFAFAEVFRLVIINDGSGLTGGPYGLPAIEGLFGSVAAPAAARDYYWTALAVATASVGAVAAIVRSPLGLALRALRDSLPYASARGIDPLRYRVAAFGLSGFLAGLAGGLYASFNGSIGPEVMGLTEMSITVTMLVVGGLGTIMGPVLGTALLTAIEAAISGHPAVELTILGAILLVVVTLFPRGLAGATSAGAERFAAWLREEEDEEEEVGHADSAGTLMR
jgi:branched-chain amino acid transport system permease protein